MDGAGDGAGDRWAASGACVLTGRSDGPGLGAPAALVELVDRAAAILERRTQGRVAVDGLALLGERAALGHLTRQGQVSCGGSTRLVRAADGWLAVSLARQSDVASLPAFLQREIPPGDPWAAVLESVLATPTAVLDERAALLGLPFAALGSVAPGDTTFGLPVGGVRLPNARPTAGLTTGALTGPLTGPLTGARVLDLSSLWAGPLCGQLLAAGGADVVKVESTSRPDGARRGPAAFFDLLNGRKRSVALDLETASGRRQLARLLGASDVVIESARPRALEQMGIVATELLGHAGGPKVWVSITSHGRAPGSGQRVGFGDVAAVAGGLVACDAAGPCFLADAVTDPVTGLVTAAAVLEALHAGGHWLIDAAMAPMAAAVAGPLLTVSGLHTRPPRARPVDRAAPTLGADTAAVLDRLDVDRLDP